MARQSRLSVRDRPRPARCPELLCSHEVLPRTTGRLAPRQRALPLLHRSYELMRQTKFLPVASVVLIPRGLCRLSSVPAARWSFPTLALRVFFWMLGPVPRRSCEVHVLVSSLTTSAFPEGHERVGDHNNPLSDFKAGAFFRSRCHS
jgi:hypothetical protein